MSQPVTEDNSFSTSSNVVSQTWRTLLVIALCSGVWGGCVSSEKYEAEKARALNFQRLLAQEEKRTGELNVKYQEVQQKTSGLESQNRDLTTELDAMREQLNRTQDELGRVREGGVGTPSMKTEDLTLAEPSISEFGLEDVEFKDSDLTDFGADFGSEDLGSETANPKMDMDDMDMSLAAGSSSYHTVAKGETLFRISRQYGVTVNDLKDWNNLSSNTISVGQKLMVSKP